MHEPLSGQKRRVAYPLLKRGLVHATPAFVAVLLLPLLIILLPSLFTIGLGVAALLFALGYFFYRLFAQEVPGTGSRLARFRAKAVSTLLFLLMFSMLFQLVQTYLLFGYKAVDNTLSPTLINGDHYFVDRLLYKFRPLTIGDVYILHRPRGKHIAAQLRAVPGEQVVINGQAKELQQWEYAFDSGKEQGNMLIVPRSAIAARAVINYWTFDPLAERAVLERVGKRIP